MEVFQFNRSDVIDTGSLGTWQGDERISRAEEYPDFEKYVALAVTIASNTEYQNLVKEAYDAKTAKEIEEACDKAFSLARKLTSNSPYFNGIPELAAFQAVAKKYRPELF